MRIRKVIEVDHEVWRALEDYRADARLSMREVVAEAFTALLKKHNRPVGLEAALRTSARRPANDDRPRR